MVGPSRRVLHLLAFGSLLASAAAPAQTCFDGSPTAGAEATGGTKFRLIVQQCPALGAVQREHHAEQLALYDRSTASVAITLADAPVQPTPATLPPAELPPLNADGRRILALAPALLAAARDNDLDPLLLHAIAHVESRHNAQAVSPAGARGVMQMMPATAQRFGVADGRALFDAETNLRAAAALLRTLRKRYGDDLRLILAAYNAGEGAVAKAGGNVPNYPETQAYVRDVSAVYRRLAAHFTVSPAGTLVARGS